MSDLLLLPDFRVPFLRNHRNHLNEVASISVAILEQETGPECLSDFPEVPELKQRSHKPRS